jgi:hypothetical protein
VNEVRPEVKVAYVMIFKSEVDDAASHLYSLIANRACGFDEGLEYWIDTLSSWLKDGERLSRLNELGASFRSTQWEYILQQTLSKLKSET